jgi:hypothetical protein
VKKDLTFRNAYARMFLLMERGRAKWLRSSLRRAGYGLSNPIRVHPALAILKGNMIDEGVVLYSQADKFNDIAGVLLRSIQPKNKSEVKNVREHYNCAIESIMIVFIEQIRRSYPEGDTGSYLQKRRNYTISNIRKLFTKYRKISHKQLMKNVWKG